MPIQFTLEQEALIPTYQEIWRRIAFSTERVNPESAKQSVEAVYAFLGKPRPDVLFFQSPYVALSSDILLSLHQSGTSLMKAFSDNFVWGITDSQQVVLSLEQEERYITTLDSKSSGTHRTYVEQLKECRPEKVGLWLIGALLSSCLHQELRSLIFKIENLLKKSIGAERFANFEGEPRGGGQSRLQCFCIQIELWSVLCCDYDYEISVLNFNSDQIRWNILKNAISNCGWLMPYENVCIICDRPLRIDLVAVGCDP
jgi:hypothetical protein